MEKVIVVNRHRHSATRHRKDCGNVARVERAGYGSRSYVVEEEAFDARSSAFHVVDHNCIQEGE